MSTGTVLDSSQLSALQAIADECYYKGGAAVFEARGILQGLSIAPVDSQYQFYYDDSLLCTPDTTELLREKYNPPVTREQYAPTAFVNAFPNPAKEQINFVYQYGGADNATLNVYNMLGVRVGEYVLPAEAGKYTLRLSNFSSGLYFYRVMTPCCEVGVGKFVVAK